ncbi:YadA-like family protein [Hoeflea marina]|uniref:YadA-like family protein n=1 Tax=Hoeflea marina TaxID=274592 RepID=UPI001304DB6C|nr:YadA-like family protein [Hoeflea marina]
MIADDLIVQGSACIGLDCTNDYAFGFGTVVLSENNTRIFFNDTSVGAFPANDWEIQVNSNVSGGENYFAIVDQTAGQTLFKICAVADTGCTNIIPGSDATTAPQVLTNTANISTNTAAILTNTNSIAAQQVTLDDHEGRLTSLENQYSSVGAQVARNKDGVAMAIALGGSAQLLENQNAAINVNYGFFDGAGAFGASVGLRVNDHVTFNGGLGYAQSSNVVGGRVGLGFAW